MKAQFESIEYPIPIIEVDFSKKPLGASQQRQQKGVCIRGHFQTKPSFIKEQIPQGKGACQKDVKERNEETLIKTLFDGIIRYAMQKDFAKAEKLRDKLIEIAPMSLSEITRSAEVIEQEKFYAMDAHKMKPWENLFKRFTKSESAAFYFALQDMKVNANEPVFKQGSLDNRLYFIHSGRLVLRYYSFEKGRDLEYGILKKGDIAGVESFFTFTNPSFTLTPEVDSQISCLERKAYEKILADNPAIESKLLSYCEELKKNCRLGNVSRTARRAHKRYETSLAGRVQRVDKDGKLTGDITSMTVSDISSGGLCYLVRNLKLTEAAHLHKSWLYLTVSCTKGLITQDVKKVAKVVSVQFHPFGDCTVHVQFQKPLEDKKVFEISQCGGVNASI